MNRDQAYTLVCQTFAQAFDKARFRNFVINLLNQIDETKSSIWNRQYIKDAFKDHVSRYERLGAYTSDDREKVDVLIVYLTNESKLERARTALRNFVADHLRTREEKEAALVAFVSSTTKHWRFSYVKMEYATVEKEFGRVGVETRFTPARRFSYIVGEGESCHTAQTRFLGLLQNTDTNPKLADIEETFSVEAVTKEFFLLYAQLFDKINKALEKLIKKDKNILEEFQSKNIRAADFAKKLLGQIVFLYFLQKKGWLGVEKGQDWGSGPHDFLRRLYTGACVKSGNFFNDILEYLFYDTLATDRGHLAWCKHFQCRIPFLNGGLFEPIGGYDWCKIDILLPNSLFANTDFVEEGITGTGVLDVFDRYNFTVNEAEPLEKEVAIDPEMLGKVFENLIEENLRKGLGAYYTPREIVHYMCQESLISYLDKALNKEKDLVPLRDIEKLVYQGDQAAHYEAARMSGTKSYRPELPKTIETQARMIDESLADITVCDPAVGSGAFPVAMMNEIVRSRSALTPYFNDVHERTPYHFKRHAIKNCLYGVDIDPGAVEIAKLRLWLSLVVDEEDVEQIRPLPNLDYKVVTGNSLICFPFISQRISEIEKLKRLFFDETDHEKKARLKFQIDQQLQRAFEASTKSLGYSVNFDLEICFSEVVRNKGGFDVVIANPPYGIIFDPITKSRYESDYVSFRRNNDIYVAFYERGVMLLAPKGQLTFISPNTFLNGDYFKKLRQLLTASTILREIWDYKEVSVFDDPTVFVCVLACTRSSTISFPYDVKLNRATSITSNFEKTTFIVNESTDAPFKPIDSLLEKIKQCSAFAQLDDSFFVKDVGFNYWTKGRGKKRGGNSIGDRVFYSGVQSHYKDIPFLKGRDIQKWHILTPSNFLKHDYEKLLDKRVDTLRFTADFLEQKPKIIYRQTANTIIAAIDFSGSYLDKTVHLIVPRLSWKHCPSSFLLGLLNSRLFAYLYSYLSQETEGRAFAQVKTTYIKKLPIPSNTPTHPIISLVDQIVAAKVVDPDYDISDLELEIDRLVYELYGLTEEEIAIVEGKSS